MSETPAEPTPAETPETPPVETPETPESDDPRVKRANAEAAKYRTSLRAQEQATADLQAKFDEQGQTLAKLAAVFNPDAGNADPAEQVQTITAEADKLRSRVGELEAELLVHNLAGTEGVNASRLLDSRTFTNALHGLDPAADNYRDQVADAIKEAVSKDASLSTGAGQGPSRGGVSGAGQGAAAPAGAVTQEQFNAMGYAERSELYRNNPDLYRSLAG